MKGSRWKVCAFAILTAAVIVIIASWRVSLSRHARDLVDAVYSSNRVNLDAVTNGKPVDAWNDAAVEFGSPVVWKIEEVVVQGSGTPVSVQVKTMRRGEVFKEWWQLHYGKIYHYGLSKEESR